VNVGMSRWPYDPGGGGYKHRWNKNRAGFEPSGKGPAGKCPKTMTREQAQELLDEGFEVREEEEKTFPCRIYNVYKGVVCEAVPTEPGKSYRGYPWRGDKGTGAGLSRKIRRKLEARASERGGLKELKNG